MNRTIIRFWALLLAFLPTAIANAQSATKAKVQIRKSVDGQEETFTEEFDLEEGQDIQDVLRELGLLDEFGQLRDGQSFEITIRKMDENGSDQDVNVLFAPSEKSDNGAFLGVYLRDKNGGGDEATAGVLITGVIEGTAAESAGLQSGDIITAVDGETVYDMDQLVHLIRTKEAGDKIKLEFLRDGNLNKERVTLGVRDADPFEDIQWMEEGDGFDIEGFILPDCEPRMFHDTMIFSPYDFDTNVELFTAERAFLGVSPATEFEEGRATGNGGMVIGGVVAGSSAEAMGLEAGDVIRTLNGKEVNGFSGLVDVIDQLTPETPVTLEIERLGSPMTIQGVIGSREYSGNQDFQIFHDLHGMDEDGNLFYNYDFEFEGEHNDELKEELRKELHHLRRNMHELRREWPHLQKEFRDELHELRNSEEFRALMEELQESGEVIWLEEQFASGNNVEEINITIDISSITESEAASVNSNSAVRLRTDNDLPLEQISFFPNPTQGQINLNFETPVQADATLEIVLIDQGGNIVYRESQNGFSGAYRGAIDVSEEANGIYYLQILYGDQSFSRKVIKGN